MKLCAVVAMADNRVIGVNNTLPWRLPEDLKRFKAITMGHPMIMGRLTYDSIGRPLPGRKTIVVTRNKQWQGAEGVVIAYDIEQAMDLAHDSARDLGVDSIMVVGGANLYEQFLPMTDTLFVTEVHTFVDGDAFFPEIKDIEWEECSRQRFSSELAPFLDFSTVEYRRKSNV